MSRNPTYEELEQRVKELEKEVAERDRDEQKLRELNRAVEQSSEGIATADFEMKFVFVNRAWAETHGYPAAELIGKPVAILDAPSGRKNLPAVWEEIKEKGFWQGELDRIRKDGSSFPSIMTASLVKDNEERPAGIIGTCMDISRLKRTEEALRRRELKYRPLIENIPAITYIAAVDENSTTIFISQQIEDLLGFSPSEWKEAHDIWLDQLHPDDRERVLTEVSVAHGTQDPFKSEYRMISRDGRVIWISDKAAIINDDEGNPLFLHGVMLDITEKMQEKKALLKARDELEQRVEERTAELRRINDLLSEGIRQLKKAEVVQRKGKKELEEKSIRLEELNTALRILLEKRDEDRKELEEKVLTNVKEMVLPYVSRLKNTELDVRQEAFADIIESNLDDIVSPFIRRLSSTYLNFTPTELQIASLVKQGLSTKEIANLLNGSAETVSRHRKSIRKKLKLKDKKSNLRTHLLSLP